MQSLMRIVLLVACCVMLALPNASAQQQRKGKNKKGAGQLAKVLEKAKGAGLTEEEMTALKAALDNYQPKLAEIEKSMKELLGGRSARRKMNQARKQAVESGKKGKERREAALAALNLSTEQQRQFSQLQQDQRKLQQELAASLDGKISDNKLQELGLATRRRAGQAKRKGGAV